MRQGKPCEAWTALSFMDWLDALWDRPHTPAVFATAQNIEWVRKMYGQTPADDEDTPETDAAPLG